MQGPFVFLVLLFAVCFVAAQSPATEFTPLVKTTLSISDTGLTNQQLPPCSSVDYVISNTVSLFANNTQGQLIADTFLLELIPVQLVGTVPLPTQPITFQLLYRNGTTGEPTPIPITSDFTTTTAGIAYSDCIISASQGATSTDACGLNYYCSGLFGLRNRQIQLIVRVSTASDEQDKGVAFNIRLATRQVIVNQLNWNVPLSVSAVSVPVGNPLFVPTVGQLDYYVSLTPKGTDRLSVATYLVTASDATEVLISLRNIRINGAETSVDYPFTLTVLENDLAVTSITGSNVSNNPCFTLRNTTESIDSTGTVEVRIGSCDLFYEILFVSVGLPTPPNSGDTWSYVLSASYTGIYPTRTKNYVPTFRTISSNNTIINSVVGNGWYNYNYYGNSVQQDYYWLNINNSPAADSSTLVVVTIFGVTNRVIGSITAGGGDYFGCDYALIDRCSFYNSQRDEFGSSSTINDFCKMQITPCQYDSTQYYYINVVGGRNLENYFDYYLTGQNDFEVASSYSLLVQVFTIAPITITPTIVKPNGFVVYTDINSVDQLSYKHYLLSLDPNTVTRKTYLIAELYQNHLQTSAILYFNRGSLAGSTSDFTYPYLSDNGYYYNAQFAYTDIVNCYESEQSCTTYNAGNLEYNSVTGNGYCSLVLPYCDLLPGNAIYFSVYGQLQTGLDSRNDFGSLSIGYNRSVSYTFSVKLEQTTEALFDHVTNVQYMPYLNYFKQSVQSHQFTLTVPNDPNLFIDQIRIALHGFTTYCNPDQEFTLYLSCDQPTGPCPCFVSEDECSIQSVNQKYCTVSGNLCDCPSGVFYLSVVSTKTSVTPCVQPTTYQLTPLLSIGELTDDLLSSDFTTNTPNVYQDTIYQAIPYEIYYSPFELTSTLAYHYYRLRYSGTSDTDALVLRMYMSTIKQYDYYVTPLLYVSRKTVSYAFDSTCFIDFCDPIENLRYSYASNYYFQYADEYSQYNYCSSRIAPCDFYPDTYLFAVQAAGSSEFNAFATKAVSIQSVDYTFEIEIQDWAPIALTIGVPLNQQLEINTYNHYSIARSSIGSNSWLRISAYLNKQTRAFMKFFLSFDGLAGDESCYNYFAQCRFGEDMYVYSTIYYYYTSFYENFSPLQSCNFFLEACDIPTSATTIYTSIANEIILVGVPVVPVDYTIVAESQGVVVLNQALGYPVTGLLNIYQVMYYSFQTNANEVRPLVIQVQSIAPSVNPSIETLVATNLPSSNTDRTCICNGDVVFDGFSYVIYNCGQLIDRTYYMTVRSVFTSQETHEPVSYTVRAFYRTHTTANLAIQPNTTYDLITYQNVVRPLNYHESIDYAISATSLTNNILYVAIADVSYSNITGNNSGLKRWMTAYLNFGKPANPSCNQQAQTVRIENTVDEKPENQLMFAFQVTPCEFGCSGTYYLSIYAGFYQPQPQLQYALNFSVAAWTSSVSLPVGFPSATTLRSGALQSGGQDFVFTNQPQQVYCDNRYASTPFYIDYFYLTPALQVNNYESLTISEVSSNGLTPFITNSQSAQGCGCNLGSGSCVYTSCGSSTTNVYYGRIRTNSCPDVDTVDGTTINFDIDNTQVYTFNPTSSSIPVPGSLSASVAPRNISSFTVSFNSGIDLSTYPEYELTSTVTGSGTCFTIGSTGVSNIPGTFCPGPCTPFNGLTLDSCCIDSQDSYTITIYNTDTSNSLPVTFTSTVTPLAFSGLTNLTLGTTSSSVTVSTPTADLYRFFQFSLLPNVWSVDSVLNLQLLNNGSPGTRELYLRYGSIAGDSADSNCFDSNFDCSGTGCNLQFPDCGVVASFGTYYIGIKSDTASTSASLVLYIQQTTTTLSGTVPEITSATSDFMTHRKFVFVRTLGDVGLEYQENVYRVTLTSNTPSNVLQLSLLQSVPGPLAGDNSVVPPNGCTYDHDSIWDCDNSNRETDSTTGIVNCDVALCNGATPESYVNVLASGTFMYVSARNIASNPTPTSFSITQRVVTTVTSSSDVTILSITPTSDSTDTLSSAACSTTTSGSCTFSNSGSVNRVYFSIPINPSQWGVYDYLMVNITSITNGASIGLNLFPAYQCEPDQSTVTNCPNNDNDECIAFYTPSTFTSWFTVDTGASATRTAPYTPINFYARVNNLASNTQFQITVRRVTPAQVIRTLSPTTTVFTQAYVMWNLRYLAFNIITPSTGDYNLQVTATAQCYDLPPVLVYNVDQYRLPTSSHNEATFDIDSSVSLTFASCDYENGGNNYFTVRTQLSSVDFTITQVKLTFTASIQYATITKLPWECSQPIVDGINNFISLADAENFGTQLVFGIENCPTCTLSVVSPLYRTAANLNGNNGNGPNQLIGSQADYDISYIYTNPIGSPSSCDYPTSATDGFYTVTAPTSGQAMISIDGCEFRNGRYFIRVNGFTATNSNSRIWSSIKRAYITPISLIAPTYSVSMINSIRGTTQYSQYYSQFFTFTIDRSLVSFVKVQLTPIDPSTVIFGAMKDVNDGLPIAFIPAPATNPGNSCSDDYGCQSCNTRTCISSPSIACFLRTRICSDPRQSITFYLAAGASSSVECSSQYELSIQTQSIYNYTIYNNQPVCNILSAVDIDNYYDLIILNPEISFPDAVHYYRVDPSLNLQFATLTFNAVVDSSYSAELRVQIDNYPNNHQYCNGPQCDYYFQGRFSSSLTCGFGNSVWYSVALDNIWSGEKTTYQFGVVATLRPVVSLGSSNPSVSITAPTTYLFDNSGTQQVFQVASTTTASTRITSGDNEVTLPQCQDGCPIVSDSQCQFMSQKSAYYFMVDYDPSISTNKCSNTTTNQVLALTTYPLITLSETTVYSISSGYQFYVRQLSSNELISSNRIYVSLTNYIGQADLTVYIGCNGIAGPSDGGSCNYEIASFSAPSSYGTDFAVDCECTSLYFTVVTSQTCLTNVDKIVQYGLRVTFGSTSPAPATFSASQALTGTWQAGFIPAISQTLSTLSSNWSITAGPDGFVHVAIGNVNTTNSYTVELYTSNGCFVDDCTTGLLATTPSRGNNAMLSCYVATLATPGQSFVAKIYPNSNPTSPSSTGYFFRALGTNSFTDINAQILNAQIQANNIHYYKVASANSNGPQSVVISLTIVGGPRLNLYAAESPDFLLDSTNYQGWYQSKMCPFGTCTIQIPTISAHPGVSTIYIWVVPYSTSTSSSTPIEAPTNYQIQATTGASNCASYSSIVAQTSNTFCSGLSFTTTNTFWIPRDTSLLVSEAQCRYDQLVACRCPTATLDCQNRLQRFACLVSFHECDAQGFWVPQCRSECTTTVQSCNTFNRDGLSCDCQASQYDCDSSIYAAQEPCTGDVIIDPIIPDNINTFGTTPVEPTAPEPSFFPEPFTPDCEPVVSTPPVGARKVVAQANAVSSSSLLMTSSWSLVLLCLVLLFVVAL